MAGSLIQDDLQIGWREDGDWVWRVAFDASADVLPTLTHLRIPGGRPLLAPPGARFRWPRLNGIDYPPVTAAGGSVTWRAPVIETLPDGGAVVRQRIDYTHPSGRRELAEYRDLVVSEVGGNGKYTLDWTSHFTAGEEGARLEDSAAIRAGLHLPLDGADEPADFVTVPVIDQYDEAPPLPADLEHASCVGSLLYPDARHPGSVALLADPRSTLGPHAWQLERATERRGVSAALLGGQPVSLAPGEVWEVSYRLVVRPKQWDAADLRLELFRWLGR